MEESEFPWRGYAMAASVSIPKLQKIDPPGIRPESFVSPDGLYLGNGPWRDARPEAILCSDVYIKSAWTVPALSCQSSHWKIDVPLGNQII
jgi:hypothetical protein